MRKRDKLREILAAEISRWSAMPYDELILQLQGECVYQVESESTQFHLDVQVLENTDEYVHVMVGIHDGSFWGFISPLSDSFITRKHSEHRAE
jgi:hypothetical protein